MDESSPQDEKTPILSKGSDINENGAGSFLALRFKRASPANAPYLSSGAVSSNALQREQPELTGSEFELTTVALVDHHWLECKRCRVEARAQQMVKHGLPAENSIDTLGAVFHNHSLI